ncbi:MAG TPA: response regulator [Longimicrobium sp.]|nr:response regulator [Longimicrobium sp.]
MSEPGPGYVLVVDDLAEQREIYRAILLHEGFRVLEAGDGDTAVSLARAHVPDVMLLDICLPGVDGFEVIRRLKADQRTRRISIVLLTASAIPEDDRDGALYDEYLAKPIQPREAVAAVRRHLPASTRHPYL